CLLLTMPLRERVLLELVELARLFGRPHEAGTLIDLALRHADLADLVGGARANVSRAVAQLRHAGRIDVVGGRFVLPAGGAGEPHSRCRPSRDIDLGAFPPTPDPIHRISPRT